MVARSWAQVTPLVTAAGTVQTSVTRAAEAFQTLGQDLAATAGTAVGGAGGATSASLGSLGASLGAAGVPGAATLSGGFASATSSLDALTGDEATCVICQMEYEEGDKLVILPCAHTFHEACVARWLEDKPTCPVCMRDVRADMRSGAP